MVLTSGSQWGLRSRRGYLEIGGTFLSIIQMGGGLLASSGHEARHGRGLWCARVSMDFPLDAQGRHKPEPTSV